ARPWGDSSGPAGGKADDAEGSEDEVGAVAQAHLDAVSSCEVLAERARDHTSELRTEAMAEIERTRRACIAEANDDVVEEIERTLSRVESSLATTADEGFDAWRAAMSD